MRSRLWSHAFLIFGLALAGVATTAEARQGLRAEPPPPEARARVLTLRISAGEETSTMRLLEGGRATLTNQESGEKFVLTARQQPSGEVALEVVELLDAETPFTGNLIALLPLREGKPQVLESRQRQRLRIERIPTAQGQLRATSRLAVENPEGEELAARNCCVTCDGWLLCGCGVDTSCGSCCSGICCDFM